jgi:hypothetical protein
MTISFARHQFPPAIIRHAVWLYVRFTLSYRDVEDLIAERGLDVSYETVRRWVRNGSAFTLGLGRLVELRKIVASCFVETIEFHNNIAPARLPLKRLVTAASHKHATARRLQSLGRRRRIDRVGFGVGYVDPSDNIGFGHCVVTFVRFLKGYCALAPHYNELCKPIRSPRRIGLA